jgi:hypothetical protein
VVAEVTIFCGQSGSPRRRKDDMPLRQLIEAAQRGNEESGDRVHDLQRDFPSYWIWWEPGGNDRPQYIARARSLIARPHTVMTADPAELRAELTAPVSPHR